MSSNKLYLRNTYFFEAIDFVKRTSIENSIILRNDYERLKLEGNLNNIGFDVINTNGQPLEVAQIIQKYANIVTD